jgi:hypothetical protein
VRSPAGSVPVRVLLGRTAGAHQFGRVGAWVVRSRRSWGVGIAGAARRSRAVSLCRARRRFGVSFLMGLFVYREIFWPGTWVL